jgi:hypothetical protein
MYEHYRSWETPFVPKVVEQMRKGFEMGVKFKFMGSTLVAVAPTDVPDEPALVPLAVDRCPLASHEMTLRRIIENYLPEALK